MIAVDQEKLPAKSTEIRQDTPAVQRSGWISTRWAPIAAAVVSAVAIAPISAWIAMRAGNQADVAAPSYVTFQRAGSARPQEPIQPIAQVSGLDPRVVDLGRRLFFEKKLSGDGTVSCASCHVPWEGGEDGQQFSIGIDGQSGDVNAPTVLNSAFNFRQFWDGRAANLKDQVDGPIHNTKEMRSNWEHILATLGADESYVEQFENIFPDGLCPDSVRVAIITYEESLTTPNSRFDRWLMGDNGAISERELRGYELFKEYQCVNCHQGMNVGGTMFQRLGVMKDYFSQDRPERPADLGRFNQTQVDTDRYVFRVPPLRNVELTAPYFHDGSAKTLHDAVRVMIANQLGRPVVDEDVELLVEFLKTLTGELPPQQAP